MHIQRLLNWYKMGLCWLYFFNDSRSRIAFIESSDEKIAIPRLYQITGLAYLWLKKDIQNAYWKLHQENAICHKLNIINNIIAIKRFSGYIEDL